MKRQTDACFSSSISSSDRRQCGPLARVFALISGDPGFKTRSDHSLNRPFPSSCLPPLQSESKCEVFVVLEFSDLMVFKILSEFYREENDVKQSLL